MSITDISFEKHGYLTYTRKSRQTIGERPWHCPVGHAKKALKCLTPKANWRRIVHILWDPSQNIISNVKLFSQKPRKNSGLLLLG